MRGSSNRRASSNNISTTGRRGRRPKRGALISGLFGERKGNAALEMAIIFPVLSFLVIGAIDFGSAFIEGHRLVGAAQAGTQIALYDPNAWQNTDTLKQAALEEYTGTSVDLQDPDLSLPITANATVFCSCVEGVQASCTTTCAGGSSPGQFVQVSTGGQISTLLSYPWLDGNVLALNRSSTVRIH
jgi:Flp pilus assembly protein TadG